MTDTEKLTEPDVDTSLEPGLPDVVEADPEKVPADEGDKGAP